MGNRMLSPFLGFSSHSYCFLASSHRTDGIRSLSTVTNIGKNCFGRSPRVELDPSRRKFLHSNAPSESFWSNRANCSLVRGILANLPLAVLEQKSAYSWHCATRRSVIRPEGFDRTTTVPSKLSSPKTVLRIVLSSTTCWSSIVVQR